MAFIFLIEITKGRRKSLSYLHSVRVLSQVWSEIENTLLQHQKFSFKNIKSIRIVVQILVVTIQQTFSGYAASMALLKSFVLSSFCSQYDLLSSHFLYQTSKHRQCEVFISIIVGKHNKKLWVQRRKISVPINPIGNWFYQQKFSVGKSNFESCATKKFHLQTPTTISVAI